MHNTPSHSGSGVNVLPIRPGLLNALPTSAPHHPETPTMGAASVVAMLGQAHGHGRAWHLRYLDGLIASHGFPAPLPVQHGETLTTRVVWGKSRWLSAAVSQWIENWSLPPGTGPAAMPARHSQNVDHVVGERLGKLAQGGAA